MSKGVNGEFGEVTERRTKAIAVTNGVVRTIYCAGSTDENHADLWGHYRRIPNNRRFRRSLKYPPLRPAARQARRTVQP